MEAIKRKRWSGMAKFKEVKKERFLGSLRCNVDEETATEFQNHAVIFSKLRDDGMHILKFGDGHIDIFPVHDEIMEMVRDIYTRENKLDILRKVENLGKE